MIKDCIKICIQFENFTPINKLGQIITIYKSQNDLYKLGDTIILQHNIIIIYATINFNIVEFWHLWLIYMNQYKLKILQSME